MIESPLSSTIASVPSSVARSSVRVLILGDNAADLAALIQQVRACGFSAMATPTPANLGNFGFESATDADVAIGAEPLDPSDLIGLLRSAHERPPQLRLRTIVQTRHLTAGERRQLLKAGADYLLPIPVEDAFLRRVVHAALMAAATSDSIQDYIACHKTTVGRLISGVFELRTMDEAEKIATMLGSHCPSPERSAVGIWELLSNAIEHGNLEISQDEKAMLLENGTFVDEIARRLGQSPYADRVARIEFRRTHTAVRLRVTDQGPGFDYEKLFGADAPLDQPNGRGIGVARTMCFDRLTYRGAGNEVEAVVRVRPEGNGEIRKRSIRPRRKRTAAKADKRHATA